MSRAPSLIALLAALLASAGLAAAIGLELRRATPDVAPRAAIAAAAAERSATRQQQFTAQDQAFDTPFDPAMVRDTVTWASMDGRGAKTTDVALVNATPGADLVRTARACARATEAAHDTAVQCYVFAGSEAYAYKNITAKIDLDEPTAIVNLCWAVRAHTARPGASIQISDMRPAPQTWTAQGCPDGWEGA